MKSFLYYSALGYLILQLTRKDLAHLTIKSRMQATTFPADEIHQGKWRDPAVLVQQDKNMSSIKQTYQEDS